MEKTWFFERLLFKVVLVMITDKKYIKATMPINFFNALHKGNVTSKSNVTIVVFEEFFFLLLLSIGKSSTLANIRGCSHPASPEFYGPDIIIFQHIFSLQLSLYIF